MFQRFDHQQAGAFGHDEAIAVTVERARRFMGTVVESTGQGTRGGEAAERDAMDRGFGPTAYGDIRLATTDQSGRIADGLRAGRASGHRRPKRPSETVPDRYMPGGHIGQERRRGEWRKPARTALVRGAYRLGDGAEPADTGGDDGRGALPLCLVRRMPASLRQGFLGGNQGELDEAIHLLAFLGGDGSLRVVAGLAVLFPRGYLPAHRAAGTFSQIGRQSADA
ncbi:hypothetical protein D3C84_59850 [compost metagenome]